jgi:hypothetical protein
LKKKEAARRTIIIYEELKEEVVDMFERINKRLGINKKQPPIDNNTLRPPS